MIRCFALSSIAVLAVAACNQPETKVGEPADATPPPPAAANVLTAQGFGPLRIGMTLAEVTAALGPDADPNSVGGADPEICDQFRPERAPEGTLVMIENGVLTRISLLHGSTVKTDRGFGVGDTAAAVKAAYGASALASPHKYREAPSEYITVWSGAAPSPSLPMPDTARGIVYEVGEDGRVALIHAGGPSIGYVEGCS